MSTIARLAPTNSTERESRRYSFPVICAAALGFILLESARRHFGNHAVDLWFTYPWLVWMGCRAARWAWRRVNHRLDSKADLGWGFIPALVVGATLAVALTAVLNPDTVRRNSFHPMTVIAHERTTSGEKFGRPHFKPGPRIDGKWSEYRLVRTTQGKSFWCLLTNADVKNLYEARMRTNSFPLTKFNCLDTMKYTPNTDLGQVP